jgi:2-polyprenyl-3-methyl-5-hydroxy-6-metoxy-1,4-benzoquinol methylase
VMTKELLSKFEDRLCPICGAIAPSGVEVLSQEIDFSALDAYGFASRKPPEHQHHRMLLCNRCDVLYAAPVLNRSLLDNLYREAAFDSSMEAACAAKTYASLLGKFTSRITSEDSALDVGTGDGAFLAELSKLGFVKMMGVEPSEAPVNAAAPEIKKLIKLGPFNEGDFRAGDFSLISCFQTIEHLSNPGEFVGSAYRLLKKNGVLMIVCHNRRGFVNKLLGKKSPIIDVEHLQLFSPKSVKNLLLGAGFSSVEVSTFANTYPIKYWLRLLPLPTALKGGIARVLQVLRLENYPVSLPVGNMVAFARR